MSIINVTDAEFERPALFVPVHVMVAPVVSNVSVVVPHPEEEAIPDSGSEMLQLTVTFPLFQPLPFGPGVTVGTITGGELSVP